MTTKQLHTPPVILVTGASRGIGRSIALHAAAAGYSVSINYARNKAAAEETARICNEARQSPQQSFIPIRADLEKPKDCDLLFDQTISTFGGIDSIVNNAGIAPRVRRDMTETTRESFTEVLSVNLTASFFLTQRTVRFWLENKQNSDETGRTIIFISSISAESASVNRAEYCISKAGLSMAAKLWAVRCAGEGIRVYELRPGIMATDMTSGVKDKYDTLLSEGLVPQKRWGQPEDVALAVQAILKGYLPFTTGDVIRIDGGLHIHSF
jgi:3-oxoacyl-[acyl-carrier protein] reductase